MQYTPRILIVDDDPTTRQVLQSILGPEGCEFIVAKDGVEGVDRAGEQPLDLILLDVMMPRMDGFEVCRHVRGDPKLSEIPILILTALDDSDSRIKGIEAGADDIIPKPFDKVELTSRVRSILRLNRYRRLTAERARFEWVVEKSDDGYLLLGDVDRILYANKGARTMLELPESEEELAEVSFLSQAKRMYRCETPQAWADWMEPSPDLEASRLLVRPEHDAGGSRWIEVSLFHQEEGGQPRRLVRLKDITSEMASQRVMWTFHSMINHKLRTPFAWLISGAHMLCDPEMEMSRQEIAEVARSMSDEANRLHGEIEDILAYLEAPTLARSGGGFNLGEAPELAEEIGREVGLEDLGVIIDPGLAEARTTLSRKAADLVLLEVLENCKKFHPEQAPAVGVEFKPLGSKAAMVVITDNGRSIPEEQLDKVWSPYYQGESDHTGQIQGMGLGLSMVASIVWEAGGHCGIYNRQDAPGVVVKLIWPLVQAEEP
jgi:DNA-binding response OmpR family regulator